MTVTHQVHNPTRATLTLYAHAGRECAQLSIYVEQMPHHSATDVYFGDDVALALSVADAWGAEIVELPSFRALQPSAASEFEPSSVALPYEHDFSVEPTDVEAV